MAVAFAGRTLVLATMHGKEQVLTPKLKQGLGVQCVVLPGIDTDQFGTFSGEVPRTLTVLGTARAKCDYAHRYFDCDLVLASEGTFGPHPAIPFAPSDHEFLLLKDYINHLEITGATLDLNTNYHQSEVTTLAELLDFAFGCRFPKHGLILRSATNSSLLFKGITEESQLIANFEAIIKTGATALVETDMRALFNPTRMQVIGLAADQLIRNANSRCPSCNTPGFAVARTEPGLPCKVCGEPTHTILKEILTCQRCAFDAERLFPHNKKTEDPMYCNTCNP